MCREARRRSARLHSLRLWSSGPARIHGIYACDRFASHGACKWTSTPVRVEIKVILHIHKVHVRGYMSGTCCRETGKPSPYSRKTRRSPRCVQRKESRLVARRSWTVWARIQRPMNVEATKSLWHAACESSEKQLGCEQLNSKFFWSQTFQVPPLAWGRVEDGYPELTSQNSLRAAHASSRASRTAPPGRSSRGLGGIFPSRFP
jgi:hypothetical protein